MIDNFAGKTAVLTGAGSGFGLECARIGAALCPRLCAADELLLLAGDICRSELLVEVDGVRQPA